MTYLVMGPLIIIFIGLGVLNYRNTCRAASKLIETHGEQLK